jgi:hypothetical protein
VQKLSGDAVVALRPADCVLRLQNRSLPQTSAQHKSQTFNFAKQGNQGRAKDNREDHCTPGKDPNGVPWKNLSRYCTVRRLPENSLLRSVELVLGAGEGNRTPDPLITNQMLYRLSYASNWGQARLRANLSHGSLPDVRDNYIKYHRAKLGCNNGFEGES